MQELAFNALIEMHYMGLLLLGKECLKVPSEKTFGVLDNYRNEAANACLSWVRDVRESVTKFMLRLTKLAMSKNLPMLGEGIPGLVGNVSVMAQRKEEEDALTEHQLIFREYGKL